MCKARASLLLRRTALAEAINCFRANVKQVGRGTLAPPGLLQSRKFIAMRERVSAFLRIKFRCREGRERFARQFTKTLII